MSFDVSLTIDGPDPVEVADVGNMTWNVSGIFTKALGRQFSSLNGTQAETAIPLLERAVARLTVDPEGFRSLEPSNGWGSVDGARDFLQRLLAECRKAPAARIEIC